MPQLRASNWAFGAVVVLLLACSSGAPDFASNSDASVVQAEAGGFCDAFAVIQRKCQRCHSDPPAHGAPFPLTSYDATQVRSHDGTPRSTRMRDAVASDYMPYVTLKLEPPVEALTCEEKATLLAWLDEGAPAPPATDPDCTASAPALLPCGAGEL